MNTALDAEVVGVARQLFFNKLFLRRGEVAEVEKRFSGGY
jgi:hypothetical protein